MALNAYLEIKGIDGESTDDQHKGQIEIESWSWGESNFAGAGSSGGGAGKVSMNDFHFSMNVSKASPKLFLACASGEHFPMATLAVQKAGGDRQDYLVWTLTDVLVSSFQHGGSAAGDPLPTESISFNFAKIEISYKEQNADGSLGAEHTAGWDLKKSQKV